MEKTQVKKLEDMLLEDEKIVNELTIANGHVMAPLLKYALLCLLPIIVALVLLRNDLDYLFGEGNIAAIIIIVFVAWFVIWTIAFIDGIIRVVATRAVLTEKRILFLQKGILTNFTVRVEIADVKSVSTQQAGIIDRMLDSGELLLGCDGCGYVIPYVLELEESRQMILDAINATKAEMQVAEKEEQTTEEHPAGL